jgi:predicted metal-dependent hydrolase
MTAHSHKLVFGDQAIRFNVVRRKRRTLQISVLPDMTVQVVAPPTATDLAIYEKMRKRAGWITRQLRYFRQFHPRTPERQYLSGETHLYLGRRYRLKVRAAVQARVRISGGFIEVNTHRPSDRQAVKEQVTGWFAARARQYFEQRLEANLLRFPDPDAVRPCAVIVRRLKQRWGSMSPTGRLIINRDLIQAAPHEIDYVIAHELCHRVHHHHGPAFYQLLTRVMPDWEKRKLSLERRLA